MNHRIVDQPRPCWALMRRPGEGRALVPARIYRKLGMLLAEVDGQPCDPLLVWHSGNFVSETEYRRVTAERARGSPF